jgi:hypothetical protein
MKIKSNEMKIGLIVLIIAYGLNACNLPAAVPSSEVAAPKITETPVVLENPLTTETLEVAMPLTLTTTAFSSGQPIPLKYSCRCQDVSPQLAWTDPPAGTQSFALIMDDPDAPVGTWVHWVIFNIPASTRILNEALPTDVALGDGSLQGMTSSRSHGYHGPCPPSGTHRYFFKLYGLDSVLTLSDAVDKNQLLIAMEGHILAQAELMGTFSK